MVAIGSVPLLARSSFHSLPIGHIDSFFFVCCSLVLLNVRI
jgi:hypothetical protein